MRQAPAVFAALLACLAPHAATFGEEAPEEIPDRLILHQDALDEDNIAYLLGLAQKERDQDWDKAIGLYEQLLTKYGDTLCPSEGDPRLYLRLADRVHRELLAMPSERLARYRLRLDAEARRLLDDARTRSDPAPAAELLRRYALSTHARPAAELLGDLLAERGESGGAAAAWEAALDPALGGGEPPPRLLAKLALSRAFAGRTADAMAMARRLAETAPDLLLGVGGETLAATALPAWIAARQGGSAPPAVLPGWPRLAGADTRDRLSPGIPWLDPTPGWKMNITPKKTSGERFNPWGDPNAKQRLPLCFHPAASEAVLGLSNGDALFLVDLVRRPGALVGRQEWPAKSRQQAAGQEWMVAGRPFAVTFAGPLAVANVLRRDPASQDRNARGVMWGGMGQAPRCGLVAAETATGKLAWQFPPKDEDLLDVRTAPVICGETLVAACTRQATSTEVWLAGISLRDGRLLWKRFLCASSVSGGNGVDVASEPALASDGTTVYCVSQRGAILAVDAAAGQTRWAYRYADAKPLKPVDWRMRRMPSFMTQHLKPLSPPILHEGVLYALPADSDRLIALEASGGRSLWQRAVEADQLVGLVGSRLVLTGALRGLLVDTAPEGVTATFMIPHGGAAGRALVTPDSVLVPTAKGIVTVDLATLKLTGTLLSWPDGFCPQAPTPAPNVRPQAAAPAGANLMAAGGWLVAAGSEHVLAFPMPETREETLRSDLQAHPEDPALHLRLGRFHRARREGAKAVASLREAWRLCQKTGAEAPACRDDILGLLGASLREEAARLRREKAPGEAAALLKELLALSPSPGEEAPLRLELARTLAEAGRPVDALAELTDVLERLGSVMIEGQGICRASDAARQDLDALLASSPDLARRRRTAAAKALEEAGEDPAALHAVIARYPEDAAADRALLRLGRSRLTGDPVEGMRLLSACALRHPSSPEALEALSLLLDQAGKDTAWRAALQGAVADQMARATDLPAPLKARLEARLAEGRGPDPWAADPFPLARSWHLPLNELCGVIAAPQGDAPAWSRTVVLSTGQMHDAETGKLVWQPEEKVPTKGWMGVNYDAQTCTVQAVIPGTPAERAGVLPGDRILAIQDTPVPPDGLQGIIDTLRPGQAVAVKVAREAKEVVLHLQLARRPGDKGEDRRFRWSLPQGHLVLLGSGAEVCAFDMVARNLAWRLPLGPAAPEPEPDEDVIVMALQGQERGPDWTEVGGRKACSASRGRLVVRDDQGGLLGIDALKGQRLWQHEDSPFADALGGGEPVLALGNGALHAVEPATGRTLAKVTVPPHPPLAGPLALGGKAFLVFPGEVLAADLLSNPAKPAVAWSTPLHPRQKPGKRPWTLTSAAGKLLVAGGNLASGFDPDTGRCLWNLLLEDLEILGACADEDTLYLTVKGEKAYAAMALDAVTGKLLWRQGAGLDAACPRPFRLGRFVVLDGGSDPDDPTHSANLILFLDRKTGKRAGSLGVPWSFNRLRAIHRHGDAILLETSSGLYCYKPRQDPSGP